jgi:hypothetical protein
MTFGRARAFGGQQNEKRKKGRARGCTHRRQGGKEAFGYGGGGRRQNLDVGGTILVRRSSSGDEERRWVLGLATASSWWFCLAPGGFLAGERRNEQLSSCDAPPLSGYCAMCEEELRRLVQGCRGSGLPFIGLRGGAEAAPRVVELGGGTVLGEERMRRWRECSTKH